MAHVFICYDREDRDFAEVVQAKLEKAGHTTALDFDILNAGDDWQDRLDDEMRNAQALVVVMTPEARASDYVAYEWAFALGAGVKVIPLELKATSFAPRLDTLHRLDFTKRSRPWDTLLAEVRKAESANPRTSIPIDAGAPAPVKQAVRATDSLDPAQRVAAIRTLAQTDHGSAREALVHAFEHPLVDVRLAAACLFPDRADPRILPGLMEAAFAGNSNHWQKYLGHARFSDEVARIGAPAVPGLLEALHGAVDERRPPLIEALGMVGDEAVRPVLLEAMASTDARTREAAAAAFGRCGDAAGTPALLSVLTDADARVRDAAAWSLGLLKVNAAVPELQRMLAEDAPACRISAARALGRIGAAAAVPALVTALDDGDGGVRGAAIEALGQLGDSSAAPDLRRLLEKRATSDQINESDSALMIALLRLKDGGSVPAIAHRLIQFRSGLFAHVEEICTSMGHFGDAGVAEVIRVLDNAVSDSVQGKAAAALERIGTPEAARAAKAWKRVHG